MASFQVNPPEQFSFKSEDWKSWITRFERFRIASELSEKTERTQVNTLIYSMGPQAEDLLESFGLTDGNKKKYEPVKKKFQEYFAIRTNIIFERAKFNQRKQEPGESVDCFIASLYAMVDYCSFGAMKDELLRDKIVIGIRDTRLSEKLQLDADLTLAEAVQQVRQSETVKQQQVLLHSNFEEDAVNAIRSSRKPHPTTPSLSQHKAGKKKSFHADTRCDRCGRYEKHARRDCPAVRSVCRKCKLKGHWHTVCRNRKVAEVEEEIVDAMDTVFLGAVDTSHTSPWNIDLKLDNRIMSFKIDTGADVTVIPMDKNIDVKTLFKPMKRLSGPGNKTLKVCDQFKATLSSKNCSI